MVIFIPGGSQSDSNIQILLILYHVDASCDRGSSILVFVDTPFKNWKLRATADYLSQAYLTESVAHPILPPIQVLDITKLRDRKFVDPKLSAKDSIGLQHGRCR